ncbi:MAG: MotA/TolQ/ExbB proton channel family protein [Treponema sp.]|nr:MotA/TolQ/ExbB proton channel family protein [Treponema sp.]MCL2236718.1 MotA/TolQ/ExbB proton channel family protein [Treponema sp.]
MDSASFSLLELFKLGGVVMWPLLAFSISVVAITIERLFYFLNHNLDVEEISQKTMDFVREKNFSGADEYLSGLKGKNMAARVLLSLVLHAKPETQFNERRAEKAAETEASNCINSLENGFNFLTALGSLSPLTGFLGTVTGMIGAFRSIAEATEVNAQIVANGIYEALITTVFGLIIAIIAMISHSVFSYIVDRFAAKVEGACTQLIEELSIESENHHAKKAHG